MMHCRQVELKYVGCCDKRTDNETDTGMRRLIYVSASYRRNVIVFVKPENEGRENEVWRMRYGVKILVSNVWIGERCAASEAASMSM